MSLRPRPGLSSRIVDGERVILDRDNGRIHQFNWTATLVWDSLAVGKEPSEIAAELSERFDVVRAQALADVVRIVEELRILDLVSPRPNGRA